MDNGFDRRGFLRLLSGGALTLASGTVLTGCGGGGGGGGSSPSGGTSPAAPATQALSGTVNTAQVGGTGLLVQSVYQPSTAVAAGGGFSTTVSSQGAHLLAVTDNAGQARALGLSMPGSGGAAAQVVATHVTKKSATGSAIDASSTATALIFLVPGIGAGSPTTAAQRVTQIQGLTAFAPLVSFLTANLPTASLPALVQAGTLTPLTAACVQEWQTRYGSSPTSGQARPRASDGQYFTVNAQSGPPTALPFALSNDEFRYVNVVRRTVDAFGNDVIGPASPHQVAEAMNGAVAPSLDSLLTFTLAQPTTASDTVNTTPAALSAVEYWVRGVGNSSSLTVPASVAAFSQGPASFASVFLYFITPLINVATGLGGDLQTSDAFEAFASLWDEYNNLLNANQFVSDIEGQDYLGALSLAAEAAFDNPETLLKSVIEALAQNISAAAALYIVVSDIAEFLRILNDILDATAVAIVIATWGTYPQVAKISLPVNATGTVGVTVQ